MKAITTSPNKLLQPALWAVRYISSVSQSSERVERSALLAVTHGLEFKVVSRGTGNVMRKFVAEYFRKPILESSDKSSLGGEHVLSTLHATAAHPSSFHLMYFQGEQDKHSHAGPRLLNIFADKPWFLYAGGSNLSVLQKDKIPLAKIAFPGNSYTQLRFPPHFIHGFGGHSFAAISTHYTDIEEVQSLNLKAKEVASKDVMEKLTAIIDQRKIEIIQQEAIPYRMLQQLLTQAVITK
jgi:hypothetical protein